MSVNSDQKTALRRLVPINRLPPENQEKLLSASETRQLYDGGAIYRQGDADDHVHYLLEGVVEFHWNGKLVQTLKAESKMAGRALDKPGRKRHTVRAAGDCVVLRIPRVKFNSELEEGDLLIGPRQVEVSEIATEKSSNWMIKMLQSDLFAHLSAVSIQKIFGRMERIDVVADEAVVNQGESGDYYYVVENGYCEVTRQIPGGREIHLADLSAGDAFGEAAIVGDRDRDATVTMLSDGTLMRLPHADFIELIREPLLHPITPEAAKLKASSGVHWLDIRYPEEFARNPLRHSHNIPFNVLRLKANRIDKTNKYIVACDDPAQSAIAAYLFIERGINVEYLDASLSDLTTRYPELVDDAMHGVPPGRSAPDDSDSGSQNNVRFEDSEMGEQEKRRADFDTTLDEIDNLYTRIGDEERQRRRVPVEDYAHTLTGQRLADLIDELAQNSNAAADDVRDVSYPNAGGEKTSQVDETVDVGHTSTLAEAPTSTDAVASVVSGAPRVSLASQDETLSDGGLDLGDGLPQLIQEFEGRVRDHIEKSALKRIKEIEGGYQEKLKRLRAAAAIEVRKRQELSQRRYEEQYKKKELQLRAHYRKLMVLANKVSMQKAQLQDAKALFDEKLTAANAVYKQVEDMRKTLREQIGGTTNIDRESA